ncbi:hypothetical protein MEO41_28790, partial [Dolichospermum sp. ST_sed4]|nr:hypothetical protein [Dolichospermum sp. ST_sed4]
NVIIVSAISKLETENTLITFSKVDFIDNFRQSHPGANLVRVKITGLPNYGTLKLSGSSVTINQEIAVENLDNLTYVPEVNWNGRDYFNWAGSSDGLSYSNYRAYVTIN